MSGGDGESYFGLRAWEYGSGSDATPQLSVKGGSMQSGTRLSHCQRSYLIKMGAKEGTSLEIKKIEIINNKCLPVKR